MKTDKKSKNNIIFDKIPTRPSPAFNEEEKKNWIKAYDEWLNKKINLPYVKSKINELKSTINGKHLSPKEIYERFNFNYIKNKERLAEVHEQILLKTSIGRIKNKLKNKTNEIMHNYVFEDELGRKIFEKQNESIIEEQAEEIKNQQIE